MALSSVGTIFSAGATSISGDIKSISFGGVECTAIDVSIMSSTSKQYVLGMQDGGQVTVSAFALASGSKPDLPLAGTNVLLTFAVTFGAVTPSVQRPIATFRGYLSSCVMSAKIDEAITVDYTIRIADESSASSGEAITWSLGSTGQ